MELKWIFALAIISIAGICSANNICDTAECETPITVIVGEEFTISLESTPSTGFVWWTDFEAEYLNLINNTLIPGSGIGAPGLKNFTFVAIAPGETEAIMLELQPWVNGSIGTRKIYPIEIVVQEGLNTDEIQLGDQTSSTFGEGASSSDINIISSQET
jgi:predicted secreted protein